MLKIKIKRLHSKKIYIYIYKSRAPLLPPVPATARAGLGRLAIWSSQHRAGSPASASPNPGADPSSGARALQLQALGETPSCGVFFLRLRPTLCWSHMFVVCHLLLPPAPRAPPHAPTHASCSVTALSGCSDGWCRGRRDRGIAADILVSRTPDFVSGIKMHTHFCALCLNRMATAKWSTLPGVKIPVFKGCTVSALWM